MSAPASPIPRLAAAAAALAAIVAALPLGRALEHALRPDVRNDHDADGWSPERFELEDRIVRLLRSGAPQEAVESASDLLEHRTPPPDALIASRARWWRDRIVSAAPEDVDLVIERARAVGFTDPELAVVDGQPVSEMDRLRRAIDSASVDAASWASVLAHERLCDAASAEALAAAREAPEPSRLLAIEALGGTRCPVVREAMRALLVDSRQPVAVRRAALGHLAAGGDEAGDRDGLAELAAERTIPAELRSDLMRLAWRPGRGIESMAAFDELRRIALDGSEPPVVRAAALHCLNGCSGCGSAELAAEVLGADSVADEVREEAIEMLRTTWPWLPPEEQAEPRALLDAIASSPATSQHLRVAARRALAPAEWHP